jgi:hypothetical protein
VPNNEFAAALKLSHSDPTRLEGLVLCSCMRIYTPKIKKINEFANIEKQELK